MPIQATGGFIRLHSQYVITGIDIKHIAGNAGGKIRTQEGSRIADFFSSDISS